MEQRGVDYWYAESDRPSHESDGEHLAIVMARGLMDDDITVWAPEYVGQPLEEQPRFLAGVDGADATALTELFVQLTGVEPLVPFG